jgi:hypothetical protein
VSHALSSVTAALATALPPGTLGTVLSREHAATKTNVTAVANNPDERLKLLLQRIIPSGTGSPAFESLGVRRTPILVQVRHLTVILAETINEPGDWPG